eukprot:6338633-Amphidinium_carterae.1
MQMKSIMWVPCLQAESQRDMPAVPSGRSHAHTCNAGGPCAPMTFANRGSTRTPPQSQGLKKSFPPNVPNLLKDKSSVSKGPFIRLCAVAALCVTHETARLWAMFDCRPPVAVAQIAVRSSHP